MWVRWIPGRPSSERGSPAVEHQRPVAAVEHEDVIGAGLAARAAHRGPAQQGLEPRLDLLDDEGLRDVVVGARLEGSDDVLDFVASADDNDRRLALRSGTLDEGEAVHPAEHQVDQHEVDGTVSDRREGGLRVGGPDDVVALVRHHQAQRGPKTVIVLQDQEPRHRPDPSPDLAHRRSPRRLDVRTVMQLQSDGPHSDTCDCHCGGTSVPSRGEIRKDSLRGGPAPRTEVHI